MTAPRRTGKVMRMRGKGKLTAACALVLSAGVLATGVVVCREAAVEHWWIHKLRTTGGKERWMAAERLAALGSRRAVPYLVEAIEKDGEEGLQWRIVGGPAFRGGGTCGSEPPRLSVTPLVLCLRRLRDVARDEIAAARTRAGEGAEGSRLRTIFDLVLVDRELEIDLP